MSLRTISCAFFWIVYRYSVIDCISSSTSQQGTSTSLTVEDKQSPVTNSFISLADNATPPSWFPEALKDIAYYLRAHKFNEYDRRYESNAKLARREYYRQFPRPPLRSLHWEVHKHCEEDLFECANYLRRRIRNAGLKRTDDTVVVIHEQQWNLKNNSKQIEIVNEDCKKMREVDNIQANPFEGPLERFQWRVTASYYMCWYTMKSHPALEYLHDKCDNFANCLEYDFGPNNGDHRANDELPYSCSLYSFCPDPCCPVKHLTTPENCRNTPDNPCFAANPRGQRECVVDRSENTDFRDVILNRWNVSCSCPQKGFVWSSFYGICVDIDECAVGSHTCDLDNEICLNLAGSFQCACKWGHTYDKKSGKCTASSALIHLILHAEENEEQKPNETLWTKFLRLFEEKSCSEKLRGGINSVITALLLLNIIK